ncbi:Hypothetical predicted protein [Lecanosticta acicola]|uniref:Uncharacterized protein n=1 Tax=Lecanosticta acicola TaxID=111012 RepID=A0AAI8Z591_9PEZI|nr:Hypothetical predicted protein [Lecanosticta acicola]
METFEDFALERPSLENPNAYQTEHATHIDTRESNAETRQIVRTKHKHMYAASRQEEAMQTYDKIRVIHCGSGKIRIERETTLHHRQKDGTKILVDFSKSLGSEFELDLEDFRNPIPIQTPVLHLPRPAIKVEEDSSNENEVNTILPHFTPSALPLPRPGPTHQQGFDPHIQRDHASYNCPGPSNISSLPPQPLPSQHRTRRVASPPVLRGYGYDGNDEFQMSGGAGSRSVYGVRGDLGR